MNTINNIVYYPSKLAKSSIRVNCIIDGEPLSKQRPRMVMNKNGGVYTPKQTKEAEELVGWTIKTSTSSLFPDADSSFGVRLRFYQKTNQRRDIDNMTKLIFDACNGIVWGDDRQVVSLFAEVIRGASQPRTELCIYVADNIIAERLFQKCPICDKKFRVYPSWKGKHLYCSRKCSVVGRRQGINQACANCGTVIYRAPHRHSERVFCSMKCKSEFGVVHLVCDSCGISFTRPKSLNKRGHKFCSRQCQINYSVKHPTNYGKGICLSCGNPTSKKEYKQCRACFLKSASVA